MKDQKILKLELMDGIKFFFKLILSCYNFPYKPNYLKNILINKYNKSIF